MHPLTAALAEATCSQVVLRCDTGTCTSGATRKIIGGRCVASVSSCSRTGSVKWKSQDIVRRSNVGSHAVIATFSRRRHSLKAAAATEDEAVDLLTLEAPSEPEPKQETQTQEESVQPTEDAILKVNVKFVLQKECHFGQQFNVVGETPELGEWDPSQAVPMEWSEGHVWSAEVPVAAGLTVKYKFVMTGKRLELEWQPGEDKVFETTDESDITVSGVWEEPVPVPELLPNTIGEAEVTDQEEARSTNGLATASADSDLQEAAVVAEAAADIASGENSGSIDIVTADEAEQEPEPEESPEIPVVDALLATAVAEVSGEVEDAAASKEI